MSQIFLDVERAKRDDRCLIHNASRSELLRFAVKIVNRFVWDADLRPSPFGHFGRGLASLGLQALDMGYGTEDTVVAFHLHSNQQPGDVRFRIRRRRQLCITGLDDLASVRCLPRRRVVVMEAGSLLLYR